MGGLRGLGVTYGMKERVESKIKLPIGPRLASSIFCKSIALRVDLNQVHFSCPMHASVGNLGSRDVNSSLDMRT